MCSGTLTEAHHNVPGGKPCYGLLGTGNPIKWCSQHDTWNAIAGQLAAWLSFFYMRRVSCWRASASHSETNPSISKPFKTQAYHCTLAMSACDSAARWQRCWRGDQDGSKRPGYMQAGIHCRAYCVQLKLVLGSLSSMAIASLADDFVTSRSYSWRTVM